MNYKLLRISYVKNKMNFSLLIIVVVPYGRCADPASWAGCSSGRRRCGPGEGQCGARVCCGVQWRADNDITITATPLHAPIQRRALTLYQPTIGNTRQSYQHNTNWSPTQPLRCTFSHFPDMTKNVLEKFIFIALIFPTE